MQLRWHNQPLYFRYNFITGQTTYILEDASTELKRFLKNIIDRTSKPQPGNGNNHNTHPFSALIMIMFNTLSKHNIELEELTRRLLWIEKTMIEGSIFEVTDAKQFANYTQMLHKLSRKVIYHEQSTARNISNIENLIRDHERLLRDKDPAHIDTSSHERIQDALFCLRDFISQRMRRLQSFKQRTQNFITLVSPPSLAYIEKNKEK